MQNGIIVISIVIIIIVREHRRRHTAVVCYLSVRTHAAVMASPL